MQIKRGRREGPGRGQETGPLMVWKVREYPANANHPSSRVL